MPLDQPFEGNSITSVPLLPLSAASSISSAQWSDMRKGRRTFATCLFAKSGKNVGF